MENKKKLASKLLNEFKGDNYIFGVNCIGELGPLTRSLGKKVSVIAIDIGKDWSKPVYDEVLGILSREGIELAGDLINGAGPNAPIEDVYRMAKEIETQDPGVVITVGAGSSIDATKAAVAYLTLGETYPDLNNYFGMGIVTKMLEESGKKLIPVVAVQITAGSSAHLTKYSNITDIEVGQKFLIIDQAIIPEKAVFDYRFSASQPKDLTMDGGLDGISHCLEVFMGVSEKEFEKAKPVCLLGIELIVNNIKKVIGNPDDLEARESIGLGTDLGGYAIMIGGTNGAHLNSFSMTDILSHGRACALMNPYYVVFFSPAIEERLRMVADIYQDAGYITENLNYLNGRELGLSLASGMINLSKDIGFPVRLLDVPGFQEEHIDRCLTAAKNPKLESKLKNMPIPMTGEMVNEYMGGVMQAAKSGDMNLIKFVS